MADRMSSKEITARDDQGAEAVDLIEIAGSSEASISIAIEDVAANQWTQRVWRPQIEPNMSALYRKPGYRPSE